MRPSIFVTRKLGDAFRRRKKNRCCVTRDDAWAN